jgi:hypothetical protein
MDQSCLGGKLKPQQVSDIPIPPTGALFRLKSGRTSAPIAEDYDDIARRLKELEREKSPPQPDALARHYTPAELFARDYGHYVPVPGWGYYG